MLIDRKSTVAGAQRAGHTSVGLVHVTRVVTDVTVNVMHPRSAAMIMTPLVNSMSFVLFDHSQSRSGSRGERAPYSSESCKIQHTDTK